MLALLRYALENRLAAFVLAATLAAAGAFAYANLTIEAFPDPTDTQVQVITLFPGQPAEEVERRVSLPLERALNGTPGLLQLRSISLFGLSFVTETFGDGVDPNLARQQTVERLAQADLPQGVQPGLGPLATPIGEVYRYTLASDGTVDPRELRSLQEWVVRPRLLQVSGVADVVSYGGLVREIHVQPDPAKLASFGVTLDDLFGALRRGSTNASGGTVERGEEAFVIRSVGTFADLSDLGEVRAGFKDGVAVRVKDLATIAAGYAPRQGVVTRDADSDAVEGIVLMRRGENPSVVLSALRERIAAINRSLPKGVAVNPFYDRTDLVNATLKTVFENLAEGALLVTLVLFAFTFSVRAALIVAAVIPLSLAASFAYLHARGMSANLLSMGAVDFGIIVDGAVILVEHLFHRVSEHASDEGGQLEKRILAAAQEVAKPTLFSLLIIIAAYLPIFSLQRVEGRIFAPMAHTVVSALLGALLVSFTLVPVLSLYALRSRRARRDSPVLALARRTYDPVLGAALRNPLAVIVLALGALLAAGALLPRLGTEFLPELNEGALYVTFTLPGNASLTEGRRLTPRIIAALRRTPEVESVLTQLGRPEDGTDPTLANNLEAFLRLVPQSKWRKQLRTMDDLAAEMTTALREIPGLEYNFSQPIRDNVAENISGQFGQIALKLYGEDLDALGHAAEQAKEVIAGVPGVADLGIVKSGNVPQLAVRFDRVALARYDLDLADVQSHLETALGGHVAGELWEGERRVEVTVRLPSASREDAAAVQRLRLPLRDGAVLPLSAVAEVSVQTGRAAITREGGRRYVGVRMNVRGRDLGSFVEEARARVTAGVTFPAGTEVLWGGEFENQQRAMARLKLVIPLALLITFLLLFSAFESVADALLILGNVPFALVGGVAALAVARMPLSVSAAVGFIALLGQAVLNGVLVVAAVRERVKAGEPPEQAVAGGAKDRLRAVLMTALLASLGLLPAALSHAMGSETQRPIAVVVVGGTISAALLTLVVLPVTWLLAEKARARLRRGFGGAPDARPGI